MSSSPAKSAYKWWESDDKTKRLYTELLAEKIAKSPKKSSKTLMRSASSCSDLRSRLEALEGKGTPPGSPVKRAASIRSLTSQEDTSNVPLSPRKYTFETVTMDTLAKYEYIKSPKKKPLGSQSSLQSSPSSASLSSLSSSSPAPSSGSDEEYERRIASWKTYDRRSSSSSREDESPRNDAKSWMLRGNDKKTKDNDRWSTLSKGNNSDFSMGKNSEREKAPTTPKKGGLPSKSTYQDSDKWKPNPMFMLMTSSSKPELKSFSGKTGKDSIGSPMRKERLASKLAEVPEYASSSSGDSMDEGSMDSSDSGRPRERSYTSRKDERPGYQSTKKQRENTVPIADTQNDKNNNAFTNEKGAFQSQNSTPNKVSQDRQTTEDEMDINQINKKFQALCEEVEQLEFKMFEFSNDIQKLKHSIGIKDKDGQSMEVGSPKHHFRHAFTLAAGKDLLSERATARALFMRQYASPTKSPRNISKLLKDTGLDKEMAEVDAKKTKALEDDLRKINEKDLSDNEIQDVLRNAKARYIDRPNFLEDIGFGSSRKNG